jgi:hypothetical protein
MLQCPSEPRDEKSKSVGERALLGLYELQKFFSSRPNITDAIWYQFERIKISGYAVAEVFTREQLIDRPSTETFSSRSRSLSMYIELDENKYSGLERYEVGLSHDRFRRFPLIDFLLG